MIERFERFSLAISEISRYWHKLTAEELTKYGLKGPHAVYLTAMLKHPEGITVSQLCEVCGKDKSDASRMLSILEKKGLVTKQVSGSSLYGGKLLLTPEGTRAANEISERVRRAVETAGKDMTETERNIFYKSLSSITANLRVLCKEGIPE